MPTSPQRFCSTAGCPARVDAGHCPAHHKARGVIKREREDPRYRTERWKRYSQRRRAEHPFCVHCGKLADVTDHIQPVSTHPGLFWAPTNHQSLCWRCNRLKAEAPRPGGG